MTDLQIALILLAISFFCIVISYKLMKLDAKRRKIKKHHILAAIGIALMGFGIYELPWGAMELYKLTEEILHLSLIENYLLWTGICLICIVLGLFLYRRGRR